MKKQMENDDKHGVRRGSCHIVAKSLLKRAKISTYPIILNSLVPIIKEDYPSIKFHSTDKLPQKVYALTYRKGNEIDIAFNNTAPKNRQKFSLAHELGHLYMGHVHGGGAIDFEDSGQAEKEANEFAAELIMPSSLMRKFIKDNHRTAKDVISAFDVSEEAIWWRINSTGLWKYLSADD